MTVLLVTGMMNLVTIALVAAILVVGAVALVRGLGS